MYRGPLPGPLFDKEGPRVQGGDLPFSVPCLVNRFLDPTAMPHVSASSFASLSLLVVAGTALSLSASSWAGLPQCRVDVLGSNLQGFGMNELGDVVGRKLLPGNIGRAFLARMDGAVEELPLPPEWTSSDAYAISDTGIIVGAVSTVTVASIGSRAAAWFPSGSGYMFTLLGELPGDLHSTALGVNNLGDIVGGSGGIGLGLYPHPVRFTDQGPVSLPAELSTPADVNNQRVVLAGNKLHDLESGETTTVPLPPGNWQGMISSDLNNVGGFCGWVTGFSGCSTFPLTYMPGTGWTFIGGCATTTSAVSINDQGDALGFVQFGGIWAYLVGEGNVDIASLIASDQGAWIITGVSTINNARQMLVGGKKYPELVTELIRLTPIVFGDLNGDGRVDGADLGLLLGAWGTASPEGDLDGSGAVDGGDLGLLLGAWSVGSA